MVLRASQMAIEADGISHCHRHLSAFKVPKKVVFKESSPRNASGKILKRELRMQLLR